MSLKQEVLSILESSRNAPISGQRLADELKVSRAAIWKAIQALKEDGHQIIAGTNRGYQLSPESDRLSVEGIREYLDEKNKDIGIIVYQDIDSTNIAAKKAAVEGAVHGTTILAEEQTKGRGRLGRSFSSPAGTGLYMSIILRINSTFSDATLVTVAAAVAVCKAVEKISGQRAEIKWVNDIFLKGKKICGILTEAVTDFESGMIESVVTGIGINVRTKQEDFPEEVRNVAGSIADAMDGAPGGLSRNQLAAEIINEMLEISKFINNQGEESRKREENEMGHILKLYKERSLLLGKRITYTKNGTPCRGTAIDINQKGNLIVRDDQGQIQVLQSGEVSIRSQSIIES